MPTPFRSRLLVSTLALLPAAVAAAQETAPRPDATAAPVQAMPTPTPTVIPVAPPPVVATVPPVVAPTPEPTRTATPQPPVREVPAPRPTPVARRTDPPARAPVSVSVAMPSSVATPSPAAPVAPPPVVRPTPAPTIAPAATSEQGPGWLWALPAAALLAAIGWVLWRRRGHQDAEYDRHFHDEPEQEDVLPAEAAETHPPFIAPIAARVPVASRARLTVALRPTRAGVNLLSATVDAEVTVANVGEAPAVEIRVDARLLSAHAGHDAELATIFAEPAARPVAPPFALAPGEERRLRVVSALPHDAIRTMTAAGRPMFVPVMAVQARYAAAPGVEGQTAASFAIGVERVGSPKLAPLWLDQPARMHDQVAARAHGVVVER